MDEKFFYNLTPEEQRAIVYRIINDPPQPTEGSSNSAKILRRLAEIESCLDRLPLTDKAHRTPDKDIPPGPYIPLAHR